MSTFFSKLEPTCRRTSSAHFLNLPLSSSLKRTVETTKDVQGRSPLGIGNTRKDNDQEKVQSKGQARLAQPRRAHVGITA